MTTRVGVAQGVVDDVGVAVVALEVVLELDVGVRAEELADHGVVDARVHVDELQLLQHLMAGVAAVGHVFRPVAQRAHPVRIVPRVAPAVVAVFDER